MENKQIALLDLNVPSSLGSNGGFWQSCCTLTRGYSTLVWRGEWMSCFSLLILRSTKQIGKTNDLDIMCLLTAGPDLIHKIHMRTVSGTTLIAFISVILVQFSERCIILILFIDK